MGDYLIHTDTGETFYLEHHGIKGQKWGVRRFQNPDRTWTEAGKKRYSDVKEHYLLKKKARLEKKEQRKKSEVSENQITKEKAPRKHLSEETKKKAKIAIGVAAVAGVSALSLSAFVNEYGSRIAAEEVASFYKKLDNQYNIKGGTAGKNQAWKVYKSAKRDILESSPRQHMKNNTMKTKAILNALGEGRTLKDINAPEAPTYVEDSVYNLAKKAIATKRKVKHWDFEMGDYLIHTDAGETFYLEHHGIKGQKWGVRRYQNPDGSLTDKGKRHYGVVDRKGRPVSYRNMNGTLNRKAIRRAKSGRLSDDQLNSIVNRMRAEKEFNDLRNSTNSTGRKVAKTAAKTAGKIALAAGLAGAVVGGGYLGSQIAKNTGAKLVESASDYAANYVKRVAKNTFSGEAIKKNAAKGADFVAKHVNDSVVGKKFADAKGNVKDLYNFIKNN